jgi:tRNA uridine 5-carboxymethylaminomethyl modification enzyme
MAPYRAALCLTGELDRFLVNFGEQCQLLRDLCVGVSFAESAPILEKYAGDTPFTRKMPLGELLKQAWLNPVVVLLEVLEKFGVSFPSDVVRTVAVELKYEGYIKRNSDQFERIQRMDATRIIWEDIVSSQNVSFECRHRISKIRPETFGQLKRIEGIRPATLAVVASRAL